jgi:hypothetical protein
MRPPFYFSSSNFAWAFFLAILELWWPSGFSVQAEESAVFSGVKDGAAAKIPLAHWAFQPLAADANRPALNPSQWAESIDRHVDAELAKAKLTANPQATRDAILRRVCLDLTGLPPSDEVKEKFLQSDSNDAYESLVDTLLASSAFGEHQAHYWLDLVRYADTHGLHIDNHREIWMYRDYVIDSFNQNKPFDLFLTEQLAGDLLESNDRRIRREQQIATGLLRLNLTTNEAGSIYEEVFAKNLFDLTDSFGTIFLGLTTQCAACHDHKSDPMTQRDYYSLAAFFNNLDGNAMDNNDRSPAPSIALPTPEEEQQLRDWQQRISEIDLEMQEPQSGIDDAQRAWELEIASQVAQAETVRQTAVSPWSMCGPFDTETIEFAYEKPFASIGKPFDAQESFRYRDTNFVWRPIELTLDGLWTDLPAIENRQSVIVLHANIESPDAKAITLQIAGKDGVQVFLNGTTLFDLNGAERFLPHHDRVVLPLAKGANELYVKVVSHRGPSKISFSVNEPWAIPQAIHRVMDTAVELRTPEEVSQLRAYYRRVWCEHPDYVAMQDEQAGTINQMEGLLKRLPTTIVYRDRPSIRPQTVFRGGRYDAPGEVVARNTPAFLPPLKVESEPQLWSQGQRVANRLDLARWVTADENPLTARATVNRFWQQFFGRGIVQTSEDLGTSGAAPSHPLLLDELAGEFRTDWDVKRLMKSIVMTRAYKRDAVVIEALQARDPENRLLARGPRFRLDAEVIRDQALALSGLLNRTMHGPSSKPPQPAGLWEAVGHSRSNTVSYFADKDDKARRRTVYTYWKRTSPPPWTKIFDAPTRETCTARREQTNTPGQALMLLNEPQYQQAAASLAKMTADRKEPVQPSVKWLFEHIVGREPTLTETNELCQLFEALSSKESGSPESDETDLAAWTIVASTLLNLDEVLCK